MEIISVTPTVLTAGLYPCLDIVAIVDGARVFVTVLADAPLSVMDSDTSPEIANKVAIRALIQTW